jgi:hypothetical protein
VAKNDRIVKMLSSSYRRWFSISLTSYIGQWRVRYEEGPTTSVVMGREFTHSAADFSASECLGRAHRGSWRQALNEVSRRYGNVWGLEPLEYVLYDECLRTMAPPEWVADFAGKPIPES